MSVDALFARDELLQSVYWPLQQGHMGVFGVTGGGKSSVARAVACAVAGDPRVQMVGIDLKRVELAFLRRRLSFLARDRGEADELLDALVDILDWRTNVAEANGWRSWPATPQNPLLLTLIDELAELVAQVGTSREARQEAEHRSRQLDRLARMGRALGMPILAATQRAEAKVIGASFRANLARRFAMASLDRNSYRMALGISDDDVIEHLAADLSIEVPGMGILMEPAREPRVARIVWWEDDQVRWRMAQTARLTQSIDQIKAWALHAARTGAVA